jgi:gluconolactonase
MSATVSADLKELVDPTATLRRISGEFAFTEGPVWNKAEQCLVFSDIVGDVRRRWSEAHGVQEIMRPSYKGNGMVYDSDGSLIICEHATSSVVRLLPNGDRRLIAWHHEGIYLNSPNDVVTRALDGSIYFTDPIYGRLPGFGIERKTELSYRGVYRVPSKGGPAELVVNSKEFDGPNGLCFSPDESLLYVNDTSFGRIKVYDVRPDGSLVNGRTFFEGVGTGVIEEGVVDGMKVDDRGNVWVSGPKGIWIINPKGKHLGIVPIPDHVGNFTWGGNDWRTLFICASHTLYSLETRVGSAPLPYHQAGAR